MPHVPVDKQSISYKPSLNQRLQGFGPETSNKGRNAFFLYFLAVNEGIRYAIKDSLH